MNTNPAWAKLLQDILASESRSLLQFLLDAYPWARFDEQPVLDQLQQLRAEEQQAAVKLANFLQRHRFQLPLLGAYPQSYTSLLFVSLDYLQPQLLAHQRAAIARLEQALASLQDAAARQQIEALLVVKRRHLGKLEELAAQPAGAARA